VILPFSIEELTADDAARYNAFFAAGAEAHSDTLRIAPADVTSAPFVTVPMLDVATFLARDGREAREWIGVGTVERERGRAKRRHIAWVLRMYVRADRSGGGVGRAILEAAIARARTMSGVAKVNLTVAEGNARAVRLYESAGFRTFAREEDAFRSPEPRAELSMSLAL
jgi:GNAT superfamily N-acetyltransferase